MVVVRMKRGLSESCGNHISTSVIASFCGQHGAVIDSCYHHYQYRGSKTTVDFTFDEWNSIKTTTGMTSEEAFRNWYVHYSPPILCLCMTKLRVS